MSIDLNNRDLTASFVNPEATDLNFFRGRLSQDGVDAIAACSKLTDLALVCCKNVPAFLPAIAGISTLNYFDICGIDDIRTQDFEIVATMKQLRRLSCRSISSWRTEYAQSIGRMVDLTELSIGSCHSFSDDDIAALAPLVNLRKLSLGSTEVTNEGLRLLAEQFPNLETLWFSYTYSVSNAGCEHLGRMSKLRSLNLLACRKLSDRGIAKLLALPELESLGVGDTDMGDAGLKKIVKKRPGLRELNVEKPNSRVRFSHAGLSELAALSALNSVNLWGTALDDDNFETISRDKSFRAFGGCLTSIGNPSVAILAGMQGLEELNLAWSSVSDRCVDDICRMTSLRSLNIEATRIDYGGAEAIRQALPEAKVKHTTRSLAEFNQSVSH